MQGMKLTAGQSTYLDFVRGMAALLVLVGHAFWMFRTDTAVSTMDIQKGGVLIFFLLSGFLISYSAFQKHNNPAYGFRDFFIDRFARIYAAYLPALVFVWLVDLHTASLPQPQLTPERLATLNWIADYLRNMSIPTWFGNLFMLQDFPLFQIARRLGVPENRWFFDEYGSGAPFWTISVEWWIYMLFGMVVVWRVKQGAPFKAWHWLLLAFVAIEPYYYFIGGIYTCLTLLWILGMVAALAFINLPAILSRYNSAFTQRCWTLACLAVGIGGLASMGGRLLAMKLNLGHVEFSELQFGLFLAVTLFAFLLAAGSIEKVPALIARPLRFLADYSFSLYLTHATVLTYIYISHPGSDNDPRLFWLSIGSANLVAIVFWWLFERHYRQFGRFLKRRFPAIQR